jgi:outer membrane protein assembly factor BamB
MADLRSLPYLSSAPDPHGQESGVLIHDKARAFEGYTLYSPRTQSSASLMEMDGTVVWTWQEPEQGDGWQHIQLLPDGGLLIISKDNHVERLDLNSNVLWRHKTRAHHDLWIKDDTLWVLDSEDRIVPEIHTSNPTIVDKITLLALDDGHKLGEIDLLAVLLGSKYRFLLQAVSYRGFPQGTLLDILHTNHVEVFDGSLAERSEIFRDGNVLVSMRNINTVAVFDPKTLSIEWLWGPSNLTFQHHPTLVGDGKLLIFDNGLERSRVLELDPLTQTVEWEYKDPNFFSKLRGSVQRLPNGNTLITESDTGHVFEVTRSGERVWEFANPALDDQGNRATVWRATRFSRDEISFLP